ncbi:MAG: hypothetical protein KGH91_01885 [Rhodospirillales bacterium]|nr:hypothetical protein [Rhodospirillales bacterium]
MSSWTDLVVGLAKACAWPSAVTFIAWNFKGQIPELFNRVEEITLQGAKFTPKTTQVTVESSYKDNKLDAPQPAPLIALSPAASEIKLGLQDDLKRFSSEQYTEVLLDDLARARLQIGHEITYRKAFGSQLLFLRELNSTGAIPIEIARDYFEKQTKSFVQFYKEYGFDGWLTFLIRNGLISHLHGKVEITPIGNDFVQYLVSQHLPEAKGY